MTADDSALVPPRSMPDAHGHSLDEAARAYGQHRLPEAAALLESILKNDPNHHDALCRYAMVAFAAGQPDVALGVAERAGRAHPGSALAQNLLGVALRQNGRLADSINRLRLAVGLDPSFFDAQVNLGSALLDAGDTGSALSCYQAALALDPSAASLHNNLGNLYRELREPTKAIAAYRRAIELDPRNANAHANLGNILKDLGDTDAAIAAFRSSLALAPNVASVWSNLLFTLNCLDRITPEEIAAEHRAYGAHFARLLPPLPPPTERRRPGRLRVGYVAADFRKHAVAAFFEPLLEAHDTTKFEVFCYYNQPRGDEVTARIRARAEHFLPVSGIGDRQLAEQIRRDGIDILLDLTGHTAGNRLPMFFLRPAPVQVTWLGYLGATGVPTIDWRLTDNYADPIDVADPIGLEAPWRLPRTLWCYRPYRDVPEVGPLPAASAGHVTFVCLNNPGKVSSATLQAWVAILRKASDARLVLLTPPDETRVRELRRYFDEGGVKSSRIEFVSRMPLADYLALYARADIALDPFPYTGGASTCDAAWMGVPVVTLAGNRPFSRSGASILTSLDLASLVTADSSGYVATAVELARDRPRLTQLRAELRQRMRASPLTDETQFAHDFESTLLAMWDRRVQHLPVAPSP
jgi:protein O-GlcNAc transferase